MTPPKPNKIRIIGGEWRGRKLPVPEHPGLRPTSDRVRETLFNWLQPVIGGAYCLDLFAGSGALGFEAVSRGAAHAVLVEKDKRIAAGLLETALQWDNAKRIQAIQADAMSFISRCATGFDIVFLDPPFQSDLLPAVCGLLHQRRLLKPQAYVYLESARQQQAADLNLPPGWEIIRQTQTREVLACLIQAAGSGENNVID